MLPAAARAEQPTLSGRWAASAMRVAWNVGDWGEACGPKPGGSGAPAGEVTIKQAGNELTISGTGRTWRTTECWESLPGMRRISHAGGSRGWRSVCQAAPGDPRQATLITTVSASDAYMTFDETGQYQFVIKETNCTASVRRSRSFKLLQREGEAPAEPVAEAKRPSGAPNRTPAPAPGQQCKDAGPPARLEVRPVRKLLRPGESFAFRALVLDARGCLLPTAPTWSLVDPSAKATVSAPGSVQIAQDAPEGEIQLQARVAGQSAKVIVEVASLERYESMLRQGGFNEQGELDEASVASIASGSIGARSSVRRERAQSRRTTFIAVVGAAALLLGILGLLVVLRVRRREAAEPEPLGGAEPTQPRPAGPTGTVCPTCREEYAPGVQFCPRDGNRLLPVQPENDRAPAPGGGVCPVCGQGFDPGISVCPVHEEELVPAPAMLGSKELATTKICPICGTTYPGDGQFCGTDGAALVPVN